MGSYRLTPQLVADHVGSGVLCLAGEGLGRTYRLYADRPGAHLNRRLVVASARGGWQWATASTVGAEGPIPYGEPGNASIEPVPALMRVEINGALEQRAGFYDECGGWSDGHDAICERLCAAFAEGDVLLVVDSPGGAAAGLRQAVEKAQKVKAQHGRRVTAFANEQIGSAAYWWTAGIADELILPADGQAGSIGARGEHVDISGMMAKEGVKKTYFADPPDKIAFAPEFPLGPVGEARGNRDVKLAADSFRAAVCASAVGLRHGLTPEFLIELGADMLTGQAAVDAGLADGVASEDDVIEYALSLTSESARAIESDAAEKSARARDAQIRASAQAPRRAA